METTGKRLQAGLGMQSRMEFNLLRFERKWWSFLDCAVLPAFGTEFYGIKEIRYLTP